MALVDYNTFREKIEDICQPIYDEYSSTVVNGLTLSKVLNALDNSTLPEREKPNIRELMRLTEIHSTCLKCNKTFIEHETARYNFCPFCGNQLIRER